MKIPQSLKSTICIVMLLVLLTFFVQMSKGQNSATIYLPIIEHYNPLPVYQWLLEQQDNSTGLLPSQQDNNASTYNNALAIMAFTLEGDSVKAKRILDFYNSIASEFFGGRCGDFNASCSSSTPCGQDGACGFFQNRDSRTGVAFADNNRWMGDNAWLLMAIHHYQQKTKDTSYEAMAHVILRFLKSLQQADGYLASGWEAGDSKFNNSGHTEGNLDAYKALSLYNETTSVQKIKDWLDFTDLDWKYGPLDLHSWHVLSLSREYGFCLADILRTDDETIRYTATITYHNTTVTGFMPFPASKYLTTCKENIWAEGTGQMAVSFYKAGYSEQGDFYTEELEKLLFEPADFPGTQALPFTALPDSVCYSWVDVSEGHVAGVTWYLFAKEHFDPFDGVVIPSLPMANPIVQIEAENYEQGTSAGARLDHTGKVFEGNAIHIAGDNDVSDDNESGSTEYRFNLLVPITITTIGVRYADDVGGDTGKLLLDGNLIISFDTRDTGSWLDYQETDFSITPILLQPGVHILKLETIDKGTYGFTIDHVQLLASLASP